jgi:hypothetical protein
VEFPKPKCDTQLKLLLVRLGAKVAGRIFSLLLTAGAPLVTSTGLVTLVMKQVLGETSNKVGDGDRAGATTSSTPSSVAGGTASTVSRVSRTATPTVVAIAIALDGDVACEGSSMHFAASGVSGVTTTSAAKVVSMCSADFGSVVVSPHVTNNTPFLNCCRC